MRKARDITVGELEGHITDVSIINGKILLEVGHNYATFNMDTAAKFVFEFLNKAEEEMKNESKRDQQDPGEA